jgi:SAM-dependent methyltransferase
MIFGPYVTSIIAVDVSPFMIDRYEANGGSFGLERENVEALTGDLLSVSPVPSFLVGERYRDFDLITVGQALHFFPSTEEAVKCLAGRLKTGGVLFVQDLYADESGDRSDGAKKRPRGYTEKYTREFMEGAGLSDFKFEVLPEELEVELLSVEIMKVQYFIARVVKP